MASNPRRENWRFALLGACALAAVVVLVFGSSIVSGLSSIMPEHSTVDAWKMCEKFTLDRLKAPATAVFPDYDSKRVDELEAGLYRVRSHIDAQNTFGAQIRNDMDCLVRYTGTRDGKQHWDLEDLRITER